MCLRVGCGLLLNGGQAVVSWDGYDSIIIIIARRRARSGGVRLRESPLLPPGTGFTPPRGRYGVPISGSHRNRYVAAAAKVAAPAKVSVSFPSKSPTATGALEPTK